MRLTMGELRQTFKEVVQTLSPLVQEAYDEALNAIAEIHETENVKTLAWADKDYAVIMFPIDEHELSAQAIVTMMKSIVWTLTGEQAKVLTGGGPSWLQLQGEHLYMRLERDFGFWIKGDHIDCHKLSIGSKSDVEKLRWVTQEAKSPLETGEKTTDEAIALDLFEELVTLFGDTVGSDRVKRTGTESMVITTDGIKRNFKKETLNQVSSMIYMITGEEPRRSSLDRGWEHTYRAGSWHGVMVKIEITPGAWFVYVTSFGKNYG